MSIVTRPSVGALLAGGAIALPPNPCVHPPARFVASWAGEPATVGTVAVVGAGKMGLPLAAQFATHGWQVIAVDVNEAVVAAINEGRSHVAEEPGLGEVVAASTRKVGCAPRATRPRPPARPTSSCSSFR
jgi:NADPH-dependent 2,4-dienoyl-CoA reductase/sulfur reductase-like enzyme